ncbi:hypothetical protein H6P81_013025 [Aristolochia fimbriata]|uniref:Embryo sac development arrest 6 n=1 Tax=Aristolochia fimbriata TaxID=158543 RepID=A0AAV7EGR7_ARIFI|nr:hypothetical protein H6P81_013025 [Aristolochia fimbriata]
MSSNAHRTCSTTLGGVSRKRRERDGGAGSSPPPPPPVQSAAVARAEPIDNRLLAGYLAHEFLMNGTLFGQKWDPARAEATPPAGPLQSNPNSNSKKAKARGGGAAAAAAAAAPIQARPHAYADVAKLLKTDGAHIPGIVNPTELARWLQI